MASLVAQMKEHLLTSRGVVGSSPQTRRSRSTTSQGNADFTLDCSIQEIEGSDHSGLSSRVSYYFPSRVPTSLNDVFRYADMINPLLLHSQVFVVQDLDGDRSYYLRMDTVLPGAANEASISSLLDNVTQDVSILLKYFRYNVLNRNASRL